MKHIIACGTAIIEANTYRIQTGIPYLSHSMNTWIYIYSNITPVNDILLISWPVKSVPDTIYVFYSAKMSPGGTVV